MTKERKQDLGGPEDEAVEQRVREMLDVNEPDPTPSEQDKPSKTKIIVSRHEDITEAAESPVVEDEIAPAMDDAAETPEVGTAPLLETAPKKSKKVTIVHDEDSEPAPEADLAAVPDDIDAAADEVAEESEAEIDPEIVLPVEVEAKDISEQTIGELADEAAAAQSPLDEEITSPETDKAVSDIVAKESDELLAAQDNSAATLPITKKKPKKPSLLKLLLTSSAFRWICALIIVIGIGGVLAMPNVRYKLLNAVGVRSSVHVIVVDSSTDQPLKKVAVTIQGKTVQTNDEGEATISELKLGKDQIVIKKVAFASYSQKITIGWGSNPLGKVALKPVGLQYTFVVTDTVSKLPVAGAEATLGESSAKADGSGKITLTLPKTEAQKLKVTLSADGYRSQEIEFNVDQKKELEVGLVVDKSIAFISKRSGKYDLYKIDADGKNETLLFAGTGSETDSIALAASPSGDYAVVVSTRSGDRASDGKLRHTASLVKMSDAESKTIAISSEIRAIDWVGSRFVYLQLNESAGQDDADRYQIMSYDVLSGDNRQLASANYFYSIVSAKGQIYYAPSASQDTGVNIGVFTVHVDGSGKESLLDKETWNILRTSYEFLSLSVQQDWYEYSLTKGSKPSQMDGQPSSTVSRIYNDNPDGSQSAWVDTRDGKGVLVVYDTKSKSDRTVWSTSGLKGPIRWLSNDLLVFRIATSTETADYVISVSGGNPQKIVDVTNTFGIDVWAY